MKTKGMTWSEAQEAMKQGKRVGRQSWKDGLNIGLEGDTMFEFIGNRVMELTIQMAEHHRDWEIVDGTKMNFEQALAAMRRGEKVRREGWPKQWSISIKHDDLLLYHNGAIHFEPPVILRQDILATDWQIVPAEAKQSCTKEHEFNGA